MKTILILSAMLLAGCSREPRETAQAPSPVPVRTTVAAEEAWPTVYEASGAVKARTAAVLSSKLMGYVREVRVQAGDRVREGQTLVVLDARELDTGYRQAEAARNEARSAVAEAENAIASAKANLDLAKVTFGRMKDLFDKRSISNQEFDEASAKLKVAQAAYEMAAARRLQLQSKIEQAEQGFEGAKITQSYGRIAAPFAGTVTDKAVEPGNLAAPGVPLVTVERAGAYRFEAAVEESKLPLVRVGQPVEVSLDAVEAPVRARVSEIVPAIDPASRAFIVKIDLPGAPLLRSGMFGRARFSFGSRKVLALATGAVSARGQLMSVLVEENGTPKMRLVTTGERSGDRVEILSGLNAGERVVVEGRP